MFSIQQEMLAESCEHVWNSLPAMAFIAEVK